MIRGLRDRGVAIIYVTHRLNEVFEITDAVGVMRDGRIVFAGPTDSVTRERADRAHHRHAAAARTREPWRPPQDARP